MVEKSRTKMGSSVLVRREERESEHHHFCVFLNFDEQSKPFAAPSFFFFLSAAGLSLSQELLHTSQHQQHQQHQHQQQHPSEETWPVSRRGERERRREQRRRKQRGASRASVLFSSDLSLLSLSSPPSTLPHETKAADTWARDFERAEQLAADVANAIQVRARARERGKTMKELFRRRRRCLFFSFFHSFDLLSTSPPSSFLPTNSPPPSRSETPATQTGARERPASLPTPAGAWERSERPSTA